MERKKYFILGLGTLLLLFCGLIYAWSLFRTPFQVIFPQWSVSQLSMTFTVSMVFFCLGEMCIRDRIMTVRAADST